ncbi:hypothetical protein [Aliarcobacter skirrowii]|jgi:hypothetical protein|uniref:Membrane protein n=1 Tax=Aliarcobacter skirrowii CCUG 10374 TaxID=1032239 RepID=A0AAD0SK07_9BACT|nr:hypothetical protein [Aliarcobacter skirrowii]AXX84084.1 putative membrane protein [Aliarcobacter skirrowii CCUG 10374]KAB0621729.1 hypothetical protein F7P70_02470 [Aliarcobacter skirrowii CCUG 10374]MDY0180136.1 hypothetical protein [Aliarcobacter skirrowii]RXI26982.1 hypothetical protein CP959_02470 [Aliarcobacter skirrowii CCUG 10374]SUV14241.1 Uncharacterised protein [Aliarcobacter skirrowii]
MKRLNSLKVGVILSLLLFLYTNGFAQNFLLNGDLVDIRAKEKILQMGNEVKSKLGVNIYLDSKVDLNIDPKLPTKDRLNLIKKYEDNILKNLEQPYVLLTIAMEQMHVNLYFSDSLKNIIDKDDILNGYVVPLLASKDKNTLASKVSAATLNGYAAIADTLAESQKIKLESSIGSEGKVSSTIWRVFIYFLVISGLLAYTYAVLRKRK